MNKIIKMLYSMRIIKLSSSKIVNQFRFLSSQIESKGATEQHDKHFPRKLFSGIQPTGVVHIGNYLGAITQWVQLQNSGDDVTFSIVDLHAMTLPHNPKQLSKSILEMTATLLACGIDPKKAILYQQSHVRQHTELGWHLSCISTMARLAHLPQFKEKSALLKEVPLGLFIYPVLQTADILLYKATHVPVGDDQLQHLQLSQDLARMFNRRFGLTFPIPHAIIADQGTSKIRSLRDPSKKMSKSDPDAKSRICVTDTPDEITKKIKKAVTDFTSKITFDPEGRPGIANLISIHSMLSNKPIEDICKEAEELDTLKYKYIVAESVIAHLSPIRQRIIDFLAEPQYLEEILRNGAERAGEVAETTMQEVRFKLGLQFKKLTKHKAKTAL